MCGRYALAHVPCELEFEGFDVPGALLQREPHYNVAPTQMAPVLARGEDGKVDMKALRWGLIPTWAKDAKIGAKAINARVETVTEKPMFRAAFKKRRCLVPASGYFEWRVEGGVKQPYYIKPKGSYLMFAGLWEAWRPSEGEEWVKTFTVLTGEPGPVSGQIHDRQPVILPREMWADWLDEPDGLAVLHSAPTAELSYHPVSRAVGSPRAQGANLIEAIAL